MADAGKHNFAPSIERRSVRSGYHRHGLADHPNIPGIASAAITPPRPSSNRFFLPLSFTKRIICVD